MDFQGREVDLGWVKSGEVGIGLKFFHIFFVIGPTRTRARTAGREAPRALPGSVDTIAFVGMVTPTLVIVPDTVHDDNLFAVEGAFRERVA